MKRLFLALMIIAVVGALVGCTKSEYRIAELEETIKRQEEEIAQLQSKISQQQGNIEQLKPEQTPQNEDNPIAKALLQERGRLYSYVVYKGGDVVKVYIRNIRNNVISFLAGRTESYARDDLDIFLIRSGREAGTIEYYGISKTLSQEKIFSISGSLTSEETKRYY